MKNKKGFTLIELMGVIVVMAIILIVSLPTVTNMMKQNTQNDYDRFLKDVFLATENYVNAHRAEFPTLKTVGGKATITIEKLLDEGLIKKTVINPKTDELISDRTLIEIVKQADKTLKFNLSSMVAVEYAAQTIIKKGVTDSHFVDGFHKQSEGIYYFNGENPDNYIKFNDELWRIVSIESNELKIVKSSATAVREFDNASNRPSCERGSMVAGYGCPDWDSTTYESKDSLLNVYANTTYFNSLKNKNIVLEKTWNIGSSTAFAGIDFIEIQKEEKYIVSKSARVGLLYLSDFVRASTGLTDLTNSNRTNYLVSDTGFWLMTPTGGGGGSIVSQRYGILKFNEMPNNASLYAFRPVVYLKDNIVVSGNGTSSNPYVIIG